MESNYELYRNLRGLKAEYVIKKNRQQKLEPKEIVKDVLTDGEEVLFELQSNDLWLRIKFNLFDRDQLIIYGSTEMRVDKHETVLEMKKKLQKFSLKLWSRLHKGDEQLYIVDNIDLRTRHETFELVD